MNRFFLEGHWAVFLGLVLAAMVWLAATLDRTDPVLNILPASDTIAG
ncbi:MAG: hypothetical protein AAGA12_10630 [Pseudomonadota bacterium]